MRPNAEHWTAESVRRWTLQLAANVGWDEVGRRATRGIAGGIATPSHAAEFLRLWAEQPEGARTAEPRLLLRALFGLETVVYYVAAGSGGGRGEHDMLE